MFKNFTCENGVAQRCGYGAWPQPWPSPTTTHDEKMGEVSNRPWSLKRIVMFTLLCYDINTWKIRYFVKVTDVWERHATKHIYFMLKISLIWWMRIYMPMHYLKKAWAPSQVSRQNVKNGCGILACMMIGDTLFVTSGHVPSMTTAN